MDDLDAIRSVLTTINDAWLHGAPEDIASALDDCFEAETIFAGPNFQRIARGKRVCIDSYADFMRQAKVLECRVGQPNIDLRGDTAVATYTWDMAYEMGGRTYRESGSELVVVHRTDKWRVNWRAVVPNPQG